MAAIGSLASGLFLAAVSSCFVVVVTKLVVVAVVMMFGWFCLGVRGGRRLVLAVIGRSSRLSRVKGQKGNIVQGGTRAHGKEEKIGEQAKGIPIAHGQLADA